jgi:hypothetical protein
LAAIEVRPMSVLSEWNEVRERGGWEII